MQLGRRLLVRARRSASPPARSSAPPSSCSVVRRLFTAPRVILLIATIGVAQLLQFGQYLLPEPEFIQEFPTPFDFTWHWGDLIVQSQHIVVIVIIPLLTGALAYFLDRTRYGKAIRASAANPDAARLSGISIKKMSTIVWTLAGALDRDRDDPRGAADDEHLG